MQFLFAWMYDKIEKVLINRFQKMKVSKFNGYASKRR